VLRTPLLHNECPDFINNVGNATFDMTYVGVGSVLIDPTNLGPRELLAIYNGNNNCIGHGTPGSAEEEMSGYYATTAVATSDEYGKLWPIYKTNYEQYPDETPEAPNAPEGASGADVCLSSLDLTCIPAAYPAGFDFGRYPAVTPSLTVEEAVANYSKHGLAHTIGSQEPSAFIDDVHASLMSRDPDIYLYTVQISGCASIYCPLSTPGTEGTIDVARAKLNGGKRALEFTRWYGPRVSYESYMHGNFGASFRLQTEYPIVNGHWVNTPFNNAGTGYNGGSWVHGGLVSPIFPMDNDLSAASYRTCQAGGTGGDNDQRQSMGAINYVPETHEYLLTFLCGSPWDPSKPKPAVVSPTDKGAAIFYSTLDADLYDLSRQDRWSPPQEITDSWETFIPNRHICSSDHTWCGTGQACAQLTDGHGNPVPNDCIVPSPSDCINSTIQEASQDPEDKADKGCDLDRYRGWYPSFMSTRINPDPTHPINPGYLLVGADGYIFSMEGCLGPTCRQYPREYNSRQFWIDVKPAK